MPRASKELSIISERWKEVNDGVADKGNHPPNISRVCIDTNVVEATHAKIMERANTSFREEQNIKRFRQFFNFSLFTKSASAIPEEYPQSSRITHYALIRIKRVLRLS